MSNSQMESEEDFSLFLSEYQWWRGRGAQIIRTQYAENLIPVLVLLYLLRYEKSLVECLYCVVALYYTIT